MGSGFFKGEKKKPKKGKDAKQGQSFGSGAPVFVMPKKIEKKRKGE